MNSTKEKMEEEGRKNPIGCQCINPHDQGVILSAIDDSIRIIRQNTMEIESDYRKKEYYKDVLNSYTNRIINLESTKKKVMNIPPCR